MEANHGNADHPPPASIPRCGGLPLPGPWKRTAGGVFSGIQLPKVPVVLERFRVGQRVAILHFLVVDDFAYGQFHLLSTDRIGNVGHGDDLCRNMPGRCVHADHVSYSLNEFIGKLQPVAQFHEKEDSHVVFPVLPDHEAVQHLGDILHLAVDLRCADADATGVEGRV